MTRYRAIVGLCVLCALVLSASTAQSASAASKGTTAFTCKAEAGGAGFSKEHCRPADIVGSGASFKHVAVAENTLTESTITNAKTASETTQTTPIRLKLTAGGIELEVSAATAHGVGATVNKKDPADGEHYIEADYKLNFEGVTVPKPAGKGCKAWTDEQTDPPKEGPEGKIDSETLEFTTFGQGDFVRIEPFEAGATVIETFWITCAIPVPVLEGTWEIVGSLRCPAEGATIVCKHSEVTTQGTLKGRGNKAGLEGAFTTSKLGGSPLSVTTVETP